VAAVAECASVAEGAGRGVITIIFADTMAERLIIQNFAGLNIDIELGRINIFIGPQASGKSVCAKCLYWFKSFITELLSLNNAGKSKKQFDGEFINRFKSYFPNIWRTKESFMLRYEIGDAFVQLTAKSNKLTLTYASVFQESAISLRTTFRHTEESAAASSSIHTGQFSLFRYMEVMENVSKIRNQLLIKLGYSAIGWQSFILAGRSFFSALKGAVLTFLASSNLADPFLRDFISVYERDRKLYNEIELPKPLLGLIDIILKGKTALEGDEDYIISLDGRKTPLAYASSGQQEVFPLILILLSFLWQSDFQDEMPSLQVLYIEEPEAHLFSESQRAMAQLMSYIYNKSTFSLQFFITTHSPYLLASFNNLVYAHQLAETLRDQPGELQKLYQVVPKIQQLPLADFRVYGFENGGVRSLIDTESGLLSADLLDSASDVTADQFGDLMALDPATRP
jgi:AAA15 family ATPase/GTPase